MLPRYSVRKPYTVLVGVVLILVLGFVSLRNMTADLLPSLDLNYAIVMTTYPGANPETVEAGVTKPIETAMATLSNIENVSSVSNENYSMVILEFTDTADMNAATVDMRESLDRLRNYFPDGVADPIIMKINPDMLPVMMASVDADGMSQAELTRFVTADIVPEFERIEGVAGVSTSGDVVESIQVILRQERIDAINEKIRAALDKKFEEGQKELDDARQKLEDGEKELDNQKGNAADQMGSGLSQIISGKTQLLKGEQEIKTKLAELQANQAKLEEGAAQLAAGRQELETRRNQWILVKPVLENIAEQLDALAESGFGEEEIRQIVDQILSGLTEEQRTAVEAMIGDITLSADGVRDLIRRTDEQIAEGEAAIIKGEAEIAAARPQLEAGIKALEDALKQLESQESSLDQALATLNKSQVLAAIEMSGAAGQIAGALAQLESAQAQLDQAKDTAYDQADLTTLLTADVVKSLLSAQNFAMPAGTVTEDGVSYLVRVGEKIADVEELRALPLMNMHMEGVEQILLSDVADVIVTDNAADSYAVINGNPGIILSMEKQTGYSTGDVSKKINARFEEVETKYEGVHMTALMDQGVYIDLVVGSVLENMIYGGLLAILVLLLFLRNFRPTLIIACSIPLSVGTAIALMYFSGITLNVISLGGLALGIGMLVDNSIVVIENIYRMRSEEGYSAKKAAVEGAREVAGAIIASTLTTVVVFLPIVFIHGITKQLFVDMGLTIAYSLLASLLIALTLVPAMAAGMLKERTEKTTGLSVRIREWYGRLLGRLLKARWLVLLAVVVALVLSAWGAVSRGTAFMPDMQSTQASVTMSMPEEASFEDVKEMAGRVIERLETIEDIETIGATSGGGGLAASMGGLQGGGGASSSNRISMYLILREDRELDNVQLKNAILDATKDLDCELSVTTSTMDLSALGGSGISVQIKGRDLEKLQAVAAQVAEVVRSTEGTTEVSDGMEKATGQLKVVVDKEKAGAYNLTVAQVFAEIMGRLSQETTATTISTDIRDLSVILIEGEKKESTRTDVREMMMTVTGEDGEKKDVPISEFVTFEDGLIQSSIRRTGNSRYMTVSAAIDDTHNIGLVSAELNRRLAELEIPEGYTVEMAGEDETINEAIRQLSLMLLLAVIFVYLVMVAQFQSLLSPFIVMFTMPLAFTGGFLALYLTGSPVSVMSMLGFIMLAGIIVNNGIVLVDYINQLRAAGVEKREAIIQAGKTRMRPVFMTALTTILGLSTMALGHDMGAEMTRPMAIVVIGGLLYGTLMTLVVVPCVYDILNRKKDMTQEEI